MLTLTLKNVQFKKSGKMTKRLKAEFIPDFFHYNQKKENSTSKNNYNRNINYDLTVQVVVRDSKHEHSANQ